MSSTFPLLRLPLLASKNVIRQINYREQYKLATLSKRMQWIIKCSTKVDDVEVTLKCKDIVSFEVKPKGYKYEIRRYEFKVRPEIPKTYPPLDTLKKQILFLKETFNLQKFSVDFENEENTSVLELEILPFLKKENLKIQDLFLDCEDTNDTLYEYVLNEYKNARKIKLFMKHSPSFQLPVNQCPQIYTDSIYIFKPQWLTIDHLIHCFMNCKNIYLTDCKITSEGINRFLHCWMEGSKIERAVLGYIKNSEFRSIMDGIDAKPIEKAIIPRDSSTYDGDTFMEFNAGNCFLITKTNGVEALVYKGFYGHFILDSKFSLSRPVNEWFTLYWRRLESMRNYMDDDGPTDEENDEEEEDEEEHNAYVWSGEDKEGSDDNVDEEESDEDE